MYHVLVQWLTPQLISRSDNARIAPDTLQSLCRAFLATRTRCCVRAFVPGRCDLAQDFRARNTWHIPCRERRLPGGELSMSSGTHAVCQGSSIPFVGQFGIEPNSSALQAAAITRTAIDPFVTRTGYDPVRVGLKVRPPHQQNARLYCSRSRWPVPASGLCWFTVVNRLIEELSGRVENTQPDAAVAIHLRNDCGARLALVLAARRPVRLIMHNASHAWFLFHSSWRQDSNLLRRAYNARALPRATPA